MEKLEKEKKKKREKIKYKKDDGHTVYDMSNIQNQNIKGKDKDSIAVSKKELRVIIKAAFETYLPLILVVIGSFTLVFVLLYFWLMK